MQKRRLGNNLEVSALGLGCMGMSFGYGPGRLRLEENVGATAIVLTSDDLREIDNAASQVTVQGARYPEALERMTGR